MLTLKQNKKSDPVALLVACSCSSLLSVKLHTKQFYIISHTLERSLIYYQANVNNGLNLKDIASQNNAHTKHLRLYIQHVFLTAIHMYFISDCLGVGTVTTLWTA